MKNNCFRNWKTMVVFCLLLLPSLKAFSVDLIVSGITTPAAANGTYVPNGTLYGHDSWKHSTQNYYIYYHLFGTVYYWDIDVDTDDADVLFYTENNPPEDSPAHATNWYAFSGVGTPIVIEAGSTPVPEINVTGNGISIADGDTTPAYNDHTQFGSADVATGTATRTYTIQNNGAATLNISGVTVGGTDSSDFNVTSAPAASVASLGTTTFTVTFNPSALGNRNATISVASDDADENPYNFAVQGRGFTPGNLVVSGITNPVAANGNYIYQGVLFNFEYWKHETLDYYLFNDDYSGRYWNIDVDTDDSDSDFLFYVASESGTPVGLTGWTANTVGAPTGSPVITDAVPVSDINVQGNGVTIIDDDSSPAFTDHTNFGSLDISSGSRARTFTIQNTGGAALTLSGSSPYVTIGGAAAADFSVTTAPAATIAGGGSTAFTVTFDPSLSGTRMATISIASDDSDENPYNFNIQGDGFTPKNLVVSGITTPAGANGNYIHQGILNEFQYWRHESGGYYIYNDEFSGSRYWDIDTDTDDAVSNFYSNNHHDDAAPVTVTSWSVVTGNAGTPSIVFSGPEIVLQGNSVEINDGDVSPDAADHTDFGSVPVVSGSLVRTFTIQNSGFASLTLTAASPYVTVSGTNAADFNVTAIPSSSIAAGGSTTFQITFDPSGLGTRSASLSIANDDSDENPYDFSIQGTGIATAPTVTTQAVTAITATTATGNGNITDLGYPNPTAFGVCWNTTGTPTTAASHTDEGAAGATGAFTTSLTGLTANSTYYVRAYATNTAGTSYGGEVSFTTSAVAATVTTQAVSAITATTATGNGNITSLGVPNPTAHGVCWNTGGTPTTAASHTDEGAAVATGAFTSAMTGLIANSTYYVRAYATNTAGTAYGGEVSFTTSAVAATVTTQAVTVITATSATGNGNITSLGIPNPTAHGVCWNTGGTPTTAASHTDEGAAGATGAFTSAMTGLIANSTYYVRAYATNTAGTSYGGEVSFTTSAVAATVTTQAVSAITATAATGNGNITSLGAPNPTAHGVCWNTGGTPTTAASHTDEGAAGATGAFTTSMTGLIANSTYYVRAYATNTAGTSYGGEVSFTSSGIAPAVSTAAASGITTTAAILNGTVNANNQSTTVTFENGLTTAYGTIITADQSPVSGTTNTSVSSSISGLFPNSTYHFRAVGQNGTGTGNGSDMTFTTVAAAPTATTNAATGITPISTTLNGTVNANNQSTSVSFEYGLTTAYGATITADQSPVSGTNNTAVSGMIAGLIPLTTYHFRVLAVNATGSTFGSDQTFITNRLNLAPRAFPDIYSVKENSVLDVPAAGVLGNDTDPENNTLNARLLGNPDHGRVTLNSNGSFVYTPNKNFNGMDQFTYAANDGELDSNPAEVRIGVNVINDPPTVKISTPQNGEFVKGIVTIKAEANDDEQIAAVDFYIDDLELGNCSTVEDANGRKKILDLGGFHFDISEGLALALDRDQYLLLLTRDMQWRYLAGPEAGIRELCSDNNGNTCLLYQNNGNAQWLKINPDTWQGEAQPEIGFSCQTTVNGAFLLSTPAAGGKNSGDDEQIVIYNEPPQRVELQRGKDISRTWLLPLTQIKQIRRIGFWLAVEGSHANDRLICLINTGSGTMQTLKLGTNPPAAWTILANGALLVNRQMQAGSQGTWGIWQYSADGWKFSEGQALPFNLTMLAALPESGSQYTGDSSVANGTYTKEWDTKGSTPGSHSIKVTATDNEGLTASDSIEVFVQNLILTLDVKRLSEKLWIIRHDYADIGITIDNAMNIEVAGYILERSSGSNWTTIREIAPSDFLNDKYFCKDNDIEAGKQYIYRVRAVDRSGTTIASSQPVTI